MEKKELEAECLFCKPEAFKQEHQVLLRSDNFYLFAGLGPIVEGYIIIAPYKCDDKSGHFHSFADLNSEHLDEVIFLRHIISCFYKDNYKIMHSGMHFEHGRTTLCVMDLFYTKHCHHAHLCCYPVNINIWNDIDEWNVEKITGMSELSTLTKDQSYLFIQTSEVDEEKAINSTARESWRSRLVRIADDEEIPSQYLRRILAKQVGDEKLWDWWAHKNKWIVNRLIKDFGNWIQANSGNYSMTKQKNGVFELNFLESVLLTNSRGNDEAAIPYYHKWKDLTQYDVVGKFLQQLPKFSINNNKHQRPTLLDAGCGPGTYLNVFTRLGLKCIGVDISKEMLKIAGDSLPASVHNLTDSYPKLHKMAVSEINFAPASFDAIWCSAVLVHLPRSTTAKTFEKFFCCLKPQGILYISAQDGFDSVIRYEGRMYFYYTLTELTEIITKTGFTILEHWQDTVSEGTYGDKTEKKWNHFILKKNETENQKRKRLIDLGERKILTHILSQLPSLKNQDIIIGVGDDCAAIKARQDEMIVVTSDPCPKPVITFFEEDDYWYYGWFSMIINISDLGSMGAAPIGILLALEANNNMSLCELDRFYEGALEAAKLYECPVIGGNIKDATKFNCIGSAFGSVSPSKILRRSSAKAEDLVIVIGDMGFFWTGVICKMLDLTVEGKDMEPIFKNLKKPTPRIKEGQIIASEGLSQCAMDSSDGLISCFYEIAKSSKNVDIELDFSEIQPDPIVESICVKAGIDPRKVMLSWGDWELVCTVKPENMELLTKRMDELGSPLSVVGRVKKGDRKVTFRDGDEYGELNYVASERFSANSYFSNGIKNHFYIMKNQPLIKQN